MLTFSNSLTLMVIYIQLQDHTVCPLRKDKNGNNVHAMKFLCLQNWQKYILCLQGLTTW